MDDYKNCLSRLMAWRSNIYRPFRGNYVTCRTIEGYWHIVPRIHERIPAAARYVLATRCTGSFPPRKIRHFRVESANSASDISKAKDIYDA